jgi:hypothetical protein
MIIMLEVRAILSNWMTIKRKWSTNTEPIKVIENVAFVGKGFVGGCLL